MINKYAFVFEKANLNDIVDLFLFCAQAKIEIPYVEEERIVKKLHEKDDPILWATYLLYSKYNGKYYNDIKTTIEQILVKRIEAIRVQKSIFEYSEFWWVLVFNKCPVLSSTSQILIDGIINSLPYTGIGNRNCADIALDVFVDYLKNNSEQFLSGICQVRISSVRLLLKHTRKVSLKIIKKVLFLWHGEVYKLTQENRGDFKRTLPDIGTKENIYGA